MFVIDKDFFVVFQRFSQLICNFIVHFYYTQNKRAAHVRC